VLASFDERLLAAARSLGIPEYQYWFALRIYERPDSFTRKL